MKLFEDQNRSQSISVQKLVQHIFKECKEYEVYHVRKLNMLSKYKSVELLTRTSLNERKNVLFIEFFSHLKKENSFILDNYQVLVWI